MRSEMSGMRVYVYEAFGWLSQSGISDAEHLEVAPWLRSMHVSTSGE